MSVDIAGRDVELQTIEDFLTKISLGSAALVLEGEAGMGKTTLWRAAVEDARALGLKVLQAEPVESETTLSFVGIGDLLDPFLDEALDGLAPVQQRALERALALGEEEAPALDPRVLRVAVMNAIRTLAVKQPVLLAIDDSQWLDFASSAALAYGVRRFRTERVGLLLSRRSGLESALLNELLRSPAGSLFTRIHVDPLDLVALGRVIHMQLGSSLPRPLLAEVHDASGGNPFFALEIVRMLQRTGASIEAGQPLPLPESLHELVNGRITALSSESRDFLLAAAAHAHPTIAITEAASGIVRADGLEPALEAHVVELEGERIRFTHPLLAAGVYEAASPLRRIEVHRRLAELLEDPEARAWQLAASVDRPDESVAAMLEKASTHARARGALRPAALLLDRACELTPRGEVGTGVRRAVDAAFLHFEAGDSRRAEAQLRTVIDGLARGPTRAKALNLLARIRTYEAPKEALELFEQVLEEADGDREILATAHEGIASSHIWLWDRFDDVVRHANVAFDTAREIGDDALAADALTSKVSAETLLSRPTWAATTEEAMSFQQTTIARRVLDQPLVAFAETWMWTDAPERSLATLCDLLDRANELGDENARPWLLALRSEAERLLGRLAVALEDGREAVSAAEQSGQPLFAAHSLALQSLVFANLGRSGELATAVRIAREADEGSRYVEVTTSYALGHLALSRGDAAAAEAALAPAVAFVREAGILEPGAIRFAVDRVEALIELGRRDEAIELLDWYEDNATRLERASALAGCARCRGLLAAQAGDLDGALTAFDEALDWHAKVELPLDLGRTLIALGAAQRRLKRRREARATLEEALAIFERIGAAVWADRTRSELKRISGRAATPGTLTPAEERVAALVAEGRTNKEVAAALFLSDRTVEGHLVRIFGKLGVRHRTEVGPALQTRGMSPSNTGEMPVSTETIAP